MDTMTVDPYEQQLLKVFHSHDKNCCGSLDRNGLTELCKTLQLEEQTTNLITTLIKDTKSKVTFSEFRDALLTLLGEMQNNKYTTISENPSEKSKDDLTSEGEFSPKIVYGSKKYGRRSKPRNEDTIENGNGTKTPNDSSTPMVQRSNSQSAVQCKKRRTSSNLKRCTSLPGSYDFRANYTFDNSFITSDAFTDETDLICTEEMLREAWAKLGVGKDGYLDKNELILVCEAIGMHKLADGIIRQLSDKINFDHKISFQELLTCLQQDETWYDVLNSTPMSNKDSEVRRSNDNMFPDSQTFQFVTLGPNGNGVVDTDVLIEMWDNVGIHSPKELLCELGFNARQINIAELAEELDRQLKGTLEQTNTDIYNNPGVALLQATLTLYQSEIKCFKTIFEQMQAEREKLKSDVIEANNRATLLAQEVDDNHSRMEQNTLNQVKLLEQRHADIMKDIKRQYSQDKDQLTAVKDALEERIASLEQEIVKLKNDLQMAQEYSLNTEKENHNLSTQIAELCADKETLSEQIVALETEKQRTNEMGREEHRMLFGKLSALQVENSQLKDKNDEMLSEIESLSNLVASMRTKGSSTPTPSMNTLDQSMEDNISIICEGTGVGGKRRSECSPSKDINLFAISGGSPRLEKIRKFSENKNDLEVPFKSAEFKSSESGIDSDALCCESPSNSFNFENENEIKRLKAKIAFLEQILVQNNIPVPTIEPQESTERHAGTTSYLTDRIKQLERIIFSIKTELNNETKRLSTDSYDVEKLIQRLNSVLLRNSDTLATPSTSKTEACAQTDPEETLAEIVNKLEQENKDLNTKCAELENCIDLLRNEYEKCEDYWQNKVDEERQLFELEQKIQNDKLSELIEKMKEYEEQYAMQDVVDTRLFPIEENNLEKQFEDLEEEFEDYKKQTRQEISMKDEEITILKEELTKLAMKRNQKQEVGVQVEVEDEETRILNKMKGFSSYVIENTSRFPEEMAPMSPAKTVDSGSSSPNNFESVSSKLNLIHNQSNDEFLPSNRSESTTPCRPKRTRKHDVNIYKKNNQDEDKCRNNDDNKHQVSEQQQQEWHSIQNAKYTADQMISMPVISFQNLNLRRNYLEQRVRHLQLRIKHQHYRTEQTLQHYWHHFNGERADLHARLQWLQNQLDHQVSINSSHLDKLEKTDMLVKDLYIENSYLIAKVQRLEQQCHMLAQCNANSYSSV